MSKPCPHCGAFGGTVANHHPDCLVVAVRKACRVPALTKFVAVGKTVMRGQEFVANAASHTMALRIARALNNHKPNARGF
jgi:hypothetical protein